MKTCLWTKEIGRVRLNPLHAETFCTMLILSPASCLLAAQAPKLQSGRRVGCWFS